MRWWLTSFLNAGQKHFLQLLIDVFIRLEKTSFLNSLKEFSPEWVLNFIESVFIANLFCKPICLSYVFSGGLGVKNTPANARHARDMGSVPELGRSPGGRNGNPFQYSCLEKSMDREEPGRPQSVVYIKYSLIYIVVYFLSPNRTLTNTTSNWRCFLMICRCSFKETFKQEIYTWKTPEYCWNLKQGLDD